MIAPHERLFAPVTTGMRDKALAALFLSAGNCLILYSSLSASLFVSLELTPTSSTGRRDWPVF